MDVRDERQIELGGHAITLTSLDRVIWPAAGFTKAQLLDYYVSAAPLLLPHIRGHGLTLARYPQGIEAQGFPQTECRGRPEWMPTQEVRLADGETRRHCVANEAAALAWIANQNTVELHAFLAPMNTPQRPDAVVLDLDSETDLARRALREVALELRGELDSLGLESFVKTSGAGGLHVYVPTGGSAGFDQCKRFARALAARLSARNPKRITDDLRRRRRGSRVLIDWTRMSERATVVAPYSLRAMSWPSVSMPLQWDELADREADELWFEPADIEQRLQVDAFARVTELRQRLPSL